MTHNLSIEKLFFPVFLLFLSTSSHAQENVKLIFNEYSISLNYTTVKDDNTRNRIGFGLGIYHLFWQEKKINLLSGIEYNRTLQYKESIYEGHFADAKDVTYYFNNISVPLLARYNLGNNLKFFVQAGIFLDASIYAKYKGYYNVLNIQDYTTTQLKFDEKTNTETFNYGPSAGLGIIIPWGSYSVLVKFDANYGIQNVSDYMESIYNRYIRLSLGLQKK